MGKRAAILGYAVEGQDSAKYLAAHGYDVTICDNDESKVVPSEFKAKLGPDYLTGLGEFDLIMRTPVIRPDTIAEANPGVDLSGKLSSGLKYFLQHCPAPVIGITGTKGKGTTTTLIAKMLTAAGKTVHLGGNIGVPVMGLLDGIKPDDIAVLEVSSFQLMDVDRSPHIAVCLMVVPEHLDWHTSFDEYKWAKGNIFRHQTSDDTAIYNPNNEASSQLVKLSAGKHVPYGKAPGAVIEGDQIKIDDVVICRVDEVGLPGPHNLQNICAAVTAVWELVDHQPAPIREVVTSFEGLPHHIELVAEIDGVKYYDDSFSTTPETAIAALKSFDGDKVIILGGSDKGIGFAELAQAVEDERVIHALLIGERGPAIAAELDKVGFTHYTVVKWQGMEALVQTASHLAEAGDVVLLSPGCASFDLFANYKVRGEQFQAAVRKLEQAARGA